MFHWRPARRLPPDIQLEVETLLADLRGAPSPGVDEAIRDAPKGRGLGFRGLIRLLPTAGLVGPRSRFIGGSGANDNGSR